MATGRRACVDIGQVVVKAEWQFTTAGGRKVSADTQQDTFAMSRLSILVASNSFGGVLLGKTVL